jgi:hypothetical protein
MIRRLVERVWPYPADLSSDVGAVGCFQNTTYHP